MSQWIVKAIDIKATVHGNVQEEPTLPQLCENSGQMIRSEHDSHFSVGLFEAEQLLRIGFWRRLQKNDAVEVASEKEGFRLALTKTRSQWLKLRLVAHTLGSCRHIPQQTYRKHGQ